jgi:hypothetical protein
VALVRAGSYGIGSPRFPAGTNGGGRQLPARQPQQAPRHERDSWRPAQTAFEQHPDTSVLHKGRAATSTTPSTQEARAIIQVAAGV